MSMCVDNTPVEDHRLSSGLWVKREDLCCPVGPHFSKTRGVYAHVAGRREKVIGVLDTKHSQGGWAVAQACALLGKKCVEFYPSFKDPNKTPREVPGRCLELGAEVVALQAGRSAVLYHQAKRTLGRYSGGLDPYMMPNALKLPEMITETAAEVGRTQASSGYDLHKISNILVSASSATIAAGVLTGLIKLGWSGELIIHQGYSRPQDAIRKYMDAMMQPSLPHHPTPSGTGGVRINRTLVDEGYSYGDRAKPGPVPPFACNEFYDLKAYRWWMREGRARYGEALLWNIG